MATLSEIYLSERGGSVTEYHYNLAEGQRLGQAFFNALSGTDQERVRGSIHDPFYFDAAMGEARIYKCIDFLMRTENE